MSNLKHGLHGTRIYNIWQGMRKRCQNPKCLDFKDYGGRGISVCNEWDRDVLAFYTWAMANGYAEDLTIDRYPNVDGNYEPSNCRWATIAQQSRNRSDNVVINFRGRTGLLSDFAVEMGLNVDTVNMRTYRGWSVEAALTTPLVNRGPRSHCAKGHPLVAENVRMSPDGKRQFCLTCRRITHERRLYTQKAARKLADEIDHLRLEHQCACQEISIAVAERDGFRAALEAVAAAKMPGESRRIAVEALRAVGGAA